MQDPRADEALMLAYAQGDVAAFDELMRRWRPAVLGLARRVLRDEALAEDACIETFLKLHRSAPTWKPTGTLRSFLFTIAWRESLNLARSQRRHTRGRVDTDVGVAEQRDPSPMAEELLTRAQELAAVEKALSRLSESQRAAFVMYYKEGLSTNEIAQALDAPSGSVRGWLTLARQALREMLGGG